MLLHLFFFKLHEPFQWCDDEVIEAEESTLEHPLYIEEILDWACGRNISPRTKTMDFVVMGLFENQKNLSAFLTHQNHLQGVLKWQKIANWQVVDIDIGSDTTKFFGLLNGLAEFGVKQVDELNIS